MFLKNNKKQKIEYKKLTRDEIKNRFYLVLIFVLIVFWTVGSVLSVSQAFKRKESNVIQASADSNHDFRQGFSYDYPAMNLLDGEFLFPVGRTAVKTDTADYVLYVAEDNTFRVIVESGQTASQWIPIMRFGQQSSATPLGRRSGETVYFSGSFDSPSSACWRLVLNFYKGSIDVLNMYSVNGSQVYTMPSYESYSNVTLYLYLGTYQTILDSNALSFEKVFDPMLCSYDIPFTPAIETVYDSGYANGNETGFMRGALPLFQDQTIYTTIRDGAGRTLMTYPASADYYGQSGAIDFGLLKQDIIQYAQDYNYNISTWYYTDLKLYFYTNGQSVGVADVEKIAVLPDSGYMSNVTLYKYDDQIISYNYQGTWVQDTENTDLVHIEIPDDITSAGYGAFSFTVEGGADNLNFMLYDGGSQYRLGYAEGQKNSPAQGQLQAEYERGKREGQVIGEQIGQKYGYMKGVEEANDYSWVGFISAIVDVPIKAFTSLFSFEILGIDMFGFFSALLTLSVILTVVKISLGK